LTIKSTSHTTLVDATFFALTLVFCNARQYSIVKDLESFQRLAFSFQHSALRLRSMMSEAES
jgi:hypothetical protein